MNHSKPDVTRELTPGNFALIRDRIGSSPEDWSAEEIGDGNVNLIFRIKGPKGQVLLKRAVPYLRCVGESWPLSLKRNFFEYTAFKEHLPFASQYQPEIFAFDEDSASMLMEFLGDHIILRKGMMKAIQYPKFSEHIADYMAGILFHTSDLFLPAGVKKEKMKLFCDNVDLCKITEDLIFTDPYRSTPQNRWTSPQLDATVKKIQSDVELKIAITKMKEKFLTSTQALIHGDLHSGSILVNEKETKVIDPEFAFYGPMGFDVGCLIANFFLSYFSHEDESYQSWILEQVSEIWNRFSKKFSTLWETDLKGDLFSPALLASEKGKEVMTSFRARYMRDLFQDSLGFAGAEMNRRILGLAHVADLDSIQDPDIRAAREVRALGIARELLVNANHYPTIDSVIQAVKAS